MEFKEKQCLCTIKRIGKKYEVCAVVIDRVINLRFKKVYRVYWFFQKYDGYYWSTRKDLITNFQNAQNKVKELNSENKTL